MVLGGHSHPPGVSRAHKRSLAVLAGTLAGALFFVLCFELVAGLRDYRWRSKYTNGGWLGRIAVASPDPVLLWEYQPNGRKGNIHVNRFGFRERDVEVPEKPAGVLRVAFVGDSVTLGFGVEEQETFVRCFERNAVGLLAQPEVEALNFGIDGYNALQVAQLVRTKVLWFQPDCIVYAFCLNDFDFEDSSGKKIRYFRRPRSFFLDWLHHARWGEQPAEFHRLHFARTREAVFAELTRLRDELRTKSVPLLVAILPVFQDQGPTFAEYSLADLHAALGSFLMEQGIACVDLLEAFRQDGRPPAEFAESPWHPSPEGHALIARALLHPVLEDLLGAAPSR